MVHPVLAGTLLRVGTGETYTSIQTAIDAASPGDSILVEDTAEPYNGFRVTTPDLFIGGDGDPVITSGGTGIEISAQNVTIDGFFLLNCWAGINSTGEDNTILNTTVIGSNGEAISSSGTNLSLVGCRFESLYSSGILLSETPAQVQDVISGGNPAFYGKESGTIARLTLNDPNSTEVSFTFSGGINVDGKPQTLTTPPLRSTGQFVHLKKVNPESCINIGISIPDTLPEGMTFNGLWIWTQSDEEGWVVASGEAGLSSDSSAVYANFTEIPGSTRTWFTLAPLETNPPTLETVNPGSAINNGMIAITIQGSRFWGEMDIKLIREEESILADAITLEDPNTLTCSFNLTDVPADQWNLVVTNPIGGEECLPFIIEGEPLAVDSITPQTATNNGTVFVEIVGSGFQEGISVNLTNETAGFSFEPLQFHYTNNTGCNATFDLVDLREGDYFLGVWPEEGTGNLTVFSILNAAPIITEIAPNTASNNETVLINVTGSGFRQGTLATISNGSWTLEPMGFNRISNSEINATFDLVDVFEGTYQLSILQDDGQKATAEFSVNNAEPIINFFSPDSATNNDSVYINVTGSGFRTGTAISISNSSWTLEPTDVQRICNKQVNATFNLARVSEGIYQISITQDDGQKATAQFTVCKAEPIMTEIAPEPTETVKINEVIHSDNTESGFSSGTSARISNHPEEKRTNEKTITPPLEKKLPVSKEKLAVVPESEPESNNFLENSQDEPKKEGSTHNSEQTSPDNRQPENTIEKALLEQVPQAVAERLTEIFDEIADALSNMLGRFGTVFGATLSGEFR